METAVIDMSVGDDLSYSFIDTNLKCTAFNFIYNCIHSKMERGRSVPYVLLTSLASKCIQYSPTWNINTKIK